MLPMRTSHVNMTCTSMVSEGNVSGFFSLFCLFLTCFESLRFCTVACAHCDQVAELSTPNVEYLVVLKMSRDHSTKTWTGVVGIY